MKYIHYILLSFITTGLLAQPKVANTEAEHHLIIHSSLLNQDREIVVHIPNGYLKSKHYPVIYLLDGEEHMTYTEAVTDRLSDAGVIPEVIVVGIINIDRTYDFTPVIDKKKKSQNIKTGGGDNFIRFIEKELFPRIDSIYSTLPYRILIGHSYGGLLATNTLFSEQRLFNAYVAIDPSLYWSDYFILKKIKNSIPNFNNTVLYTSSIIDPKYPVDSTSNGVGITALKKLLNDKSFHGLSYKFQNFEEENHESVPTVSILSGLRFIFHDYYFPYVYSDSIILNPQKITAHYAAVSKKLGATFLPPEKLIDELGFYALNELHNVNKAIDLLTLNTINYPKSPHAFNSLSIAFREQGDNSSSLKSYYISVDLLILQAGGGE